MAHDDTACLKFAQPAAMINAGMLVTVVSVNP